MEIVTLWSLAWMQMSSLSSTHMSTAAKFPVPDVLELANLYFWTHFRSNLSINMNQIPFLFFSVSRILQKCFPNPSVPLSILVIISRRPHVSADCHFPDIPLGPYFVESPRKELFSHSGHKPRLGRPGTTVELTRVFFLNEAH